VPSGESGLAFFREASSAALAPNLSVKVVFFPSERVGSMGASGGLSEEKGTFRRVPTAGVWSASEVEGRGIVGTEREGLRGTITAERSRGGGAEEGSWLSDARRCRVGIDSAGFRRICPGVESFLPANKGEAGEEATGEERGEE